MFSLKEAISSTPQHPKSLRDNKFKRAGGELRPVDYTGRLFREGKSAVSGEVAAILDRVGTSADHWEARLRALRGGRLLGRFFAATRHRLREVAERLGLRRVANLGGCPAR
jgi:hypothetical protein